MAALPWPRREVHLQRLRPHSLLGGVSGAALLAGATLHGMAGRPPRAPCAPLTPLLSLVCSNAKQVASYYVLRFGFEFVAYRGLETGNRDYATHVVRQNRIVFAFSSPLNPVETEMGRR